MVPTYNPFEQQGPAVAPLLLFLEELEAGAGAGQEHPEALCGEGDPSAWVLSSPPAQTLTLLSPSPDLPIGGRDKAQKLVHVAHGQPVHEELQRGLHPLCVEEVPHHLGDPAATGPGAQGVKKGVLN